jgi:flagellar biosynthesis component FlhA
MYQIEQKGVYLHSIKRDMSNHQQQIAEGVTGTISSILLSVPAWMLDIEFALKIICLILSGVASVITIYKMNKKRR